MGGAGLCLGLSGMPISGWAAVPGFSWLSFVYASFHLASGQAPDLLRSPLFPSSYLEGGLPRPLSFPFGNSFTPQPPREDLAPPELRPASICTASGVFSPEKQYISRQILLMHCLVDNLGIYLIGYLLEQGYL